MIKRDDLTGFSFGGNKVRSAEYLIAQALSESRTHLVICGHAHSNYVRVITNASIVAGLRPILSLYGRRPTRLEGNWKVINSLNPECHFSGRDERESADVLGEDLLKLLIDEGRSGMLIPRGGATGVAALGYLEFVIELRQQLGDDEIDLVLAVGGGATIAGIWAGVSILDLNWNIRGICTSKSASESRKVAERIASMAILLLGMKTIPRLSTRIEFISCETDKSEFGQWNSQTVNVIQDTLRRDGLVFDPVFGGKAFAEMLRLRFSEKSSGDRPTVFLPGGGLPSFFVEGLQF